MSWRLRVMVGSVSMTSVTMLSVVPAFDAVKMGETSAVTCTVSVSVCSCSCTGTSTDSPSDTLMLPIAASRKLGIATVTW